MDEKRIQTLVKLVAAWAKVPSEQVNFGLMYSYPEPPSFESDKRWMLRWGVNPLGPKKPAKRMHRGPIGYPAENSFGDTPEEAFDVAIKLLRGRMKESAA